MWERGKVSLTWKNADCQDLHEPQEGDTLQVKATSTRGLVGDPALAWSQRLEVEVGGAGTVAQAGVVGPRSTT